MEVHGVGLGNPQIEKLFDVACTLIDVLSCVPIEPPSQDFGPTPLDYLNHLIHLISTLRGGESRYLPLIMDKIGETLPTHMAASITQPMMPVKMEQHSPEMTPLSWPQLSHENSTEGERSEAGSSPYHTPPTFMGY
ncbi:MAG: hypothetical protein Q9183_006110 [Haloplaca sp. 2 TL-2023]